MVCCGPKCKKWTTFSVSVTLVLLGILLVTLWSSMIHNIINYQLSVANEHTIGFSMWKETPIPMYMSFYLFNLTNSEEWQRNKSVKPDLQECGPYTFSEHHIREQIVFNDNNNTLTYKTRRIWHYMPEKSNGSLDDQITTVNVILSTIASLVGPKHYLVRRMVNFLLVEKNVTLAVTRSARKFLFEGYDDNMLDLIHKLKFKGIVIPFEKFGWFVDRNNSVDYDGVFNMYTGVDNIEKLGIFTRWNYQPENLVWNGTCGEIKGTSGELWYPPENDSSVLVFAPDICSTVRLDYDGVGEWHGIEGHNYMGTDYNFDNGSIYEDMECFQNPNETLRKGMRGVSKCKFGAPVYVSYPHFRLADEWYRDAVTGMSPDATKHRFSLMLEPSTGLPLRVHASLQINIWVQNIKGIDILENIQPVFLPAMWFIQSADLSTSLANEGKMMLVLPFVGVYTGYGFIGLGILILAIGAYVTYRRAWGGSIDDEQLLTQESL